MKLKRSIRNFLLFSIFAAIMTGWLLSAAFNFHDSREQVEELFDAELAQLSRVLQAIFVASMEQNAGLERPVLNYLDQDVLAQNFGDNEYSEIGHKYERKMALQVWDNAGRLILTNHLKLPLNFSKLQSGYQDLESNRILWRTFTLHDAENSLWIRVAQREDVRTELTSEIAWHATLPGLLLVPLLLIVSGIAIRKGLTPLSAISRELKGRDYDNLSPLEDSQYPRELNQLVDELNMLFQRVSESYSREKRFTADAAHELRTPLSITKVHLQNIQQISENPQTLHYVKNALTGVDRLIHLVQQLLVLSRLEASYDAQQTTQINLSQLSLEVLHEMKDNPNYEGLSVSQEIKPEVFCNGSETNYRILLRNLIDNACRYAHDNTQIEIELNEKGFCVRNESNGISPEDLPHIFDRFKRGDQTKSSGSGLGLSICQHICQQYDWQIDVRNINENYKGVETRVKF